MLEGSIPAEARQPGTTIQLSGWPEGIEGKEPTLDRDGNFHAEVSATRWRIEAVQGKRQLAELPGGVLVTAGQKLKDLKLQPIPAEKQIPEKISITQSRPGKDQAVTWVKGVVRDPAGRPIAGATVCAYAIYHGGIRMYESVKSATTDHEGRYEIKGEGGLSMFSASVVAHVDGKPTAWAWIKGQGVEWVATGTPNPPAPLAPTVDLVIPDRGGELAVTVVQDGKPVAGASVGLQQEGVNLRDQWATSRRHFAPARCHSIDCPPRQDDECRRSRDIPSTASWQLSNTCRDGRRGKAAGVKRILAQLFR